MYNLPSFEQYYDYEASAVPEEATCLHPDAAVHVKLAHDVHAHKKGFLWQ